MRKLSKQSTQVKIRNRYWTMSWLRRILAKLANIQLWILIITTLIMIIYLYQSFVFSVQLSVAQDQEKRQVRAYLGADHALIDRAENRIAIDIILKNYGQSPATHINLRTAVNIFEKRLSDDYDLTHQTYSPESRNDVFYPQADLHIVKTFHFDVGDDWEAGKKVIVYSGVFVYLDVFSIVRKLPFCFVFGKHQTDNAKRDGTDNQSLRCDSVYLGETD